MSGSHNNAHSMRTVYETLFRIINGENIMPSLVESCLVLLHTRIKEQLAVTEGLHAAYEERISTLTKLVLSKDFEGAKKFVDLPIHVILARSVNTAFELNLNISKQPQAYSAACKLLNAAILGVEEERSSALFVSFYEMYDEATQGREIGQLPKTFVECNDILESFYVLSKQLRTVGELA